MQPSSPQWPDRPPQSPQAPTPGGWLAGSRLTVIFGGVAIVTTILTVALIGTLIVVLQRGAPGGASSGGLQPGVASAQTATTSSVQATSTAEGTPAASGTDTTTTHGTTPHSTPTPKPTPTPAGPPSVHILSRSVAGKSNSPITVSCPSSELALSGGWSSSVKSIQATYSKPSGNGWQALVNTLNVGLIPTTTAYVVCLRNAGGVTVNRRQYTVRVAAHDNEVQVTAECNPGEFAVGGGVDGSGLIIWRLVGAGDQFYAYLHNLTDASQSVTTYAECMSSTQAKLVPGHSLQTTLNAGASVALQVNCPTGAMIGGASFFAMNDIALYDYSPSDSSTWQAHVLNQAGSAQEVDLAPLCLTFS